LGCNTTGTSNIGIGNGAGSSILTGANNTVIGCLTAAAGCVCTLLIGAGTCERIRVDNSGLYVNNSAILAANIQEFTASASQTTFTVSGGYTVGTAQVTANGIDLGSGDFTASNGSTVILNAARNAGDVIRIRSGGTSSTVNNIQNFSIAMSVAMGM
jgi:hypothetical protein